MGETVRSSSQLLLSEMRCFFLAVFLAAPGKIKAAAVSEFNPEVNSVMPPPPKKGARGDLQWQLYLRLLAGKQPGRERGGILQVRGLHRLLHPVGSLRWQVHHPGSV